MAVPQQEKGVRNDQMAQQLVQQQQGRAPRNQPRGGDNRGETESAMFQPRGRGNDVDVNADPEEMARRARNLKEDPALLERMRREDERRRKDREGRGQGDGSFGQDRPPRRDPKPVVGQEAQVRERENKQENKTANLILELGKISVAVKVLCEGTLKYAEHEDTESTDVEEERNRLTAELVSYIKAADELRQMLVSKERPTVGDLEVTKAQTTIHIMELLREVDNIDTQAVKLPDVQIIEGRRLEKAKNELRRFVGDFDSIVEIPAAALRPGTITPRIPEVNIANEAERIKHNNPPLGKLWNVFNKQEDTVSSLIAWHREYILGGGIDTFRKGNTKTELSEEEISGLKEVLSVLAENIRALYQEKNPSDTLIRSRESDYYIYAEILSGKPKPGSPSEELLKTLSVDKIKKELNRISGNSGLSTPESQASKVTPAMNAEIIRRYTSGEQITVEELSGQGYSPEESSDLLKLLGLMKK